MKQSQTGILFILSVFSLIISCTPETGSSKKNNYTYTPDTHWTIMAYIGGDNDLELDLLYNIEQMKSGYSGGINLIVLVDRVAWYTSNSTILGEDFQGTRLYRIEQGKATRVYGDETFPELADGAEYETNTGDAETLQKFIKYCKKNYPAEYYALILGSHGDGSRSIISKNSSYSANVVVDTTSKDSIYTAEFTDVLDKSDSIDVLGIDACYMGNIEFVYQLSDSEKFHADYIVASPALEWGSGWNYAQILSRINGSSDETTDETEYTTGSIEKKYASSHLTPKDFSRIIVEEQYDYTDASVNTVQTLSCFETAKIRTVKNQIDVLSKLIADNSADIIALRGSGSLSQDTILHYFSSDDLAVWKNNPYFDIYDLADKIATSDLSDDIKSAAGKLKTDVDDAVLYSFAGGDYTNAIRNTTGLSVFFPDGTRLYNGKPIWSYLYWYTPLTVSEHFTGEYYGILSFCGDNATQGNGVVDNWFELLDSWFDIGTDYNYYTP